MDTGSLNKRVTILARGAGVDGWGQPQPNSWVEHGKAWVNIKHLSGSQAIKADAPVSTVRASIRTRYRTDLDAGMRVLHKTTTYDIQAVLPDEVNQEHVDLVCEVMK